MVAACRKATGIKGWKETSADGLFTMTEVECVGACVNAPVLQVDDDFYEDMDAERTTALLAALRRGEKPPSARRSGGQLGARGRPDHADDARLQAARCRRGALSRC